MSSIDINAIASVESFPPPLVKLVPNLDTIFILAKSFDVYEISRLVGSEIRKVRKGIYCIRLGSRTLISPHLVSVALSFCPLYMYYCLSLGSIVLTSRQVRGLAIGYLVHKVYVHEFKKSNFGGLALDEVEVSGEAFGLDFVGRIDLLYVSTRRLGKVRKGIVACGDVYVIEIKSGREARLGAFAQVLIYRKLLGFGKCFVVTREHAYRLVKTRKLESIVENVLRELLRAREPPTHLARLDSCSSCPFAMLTFCELHKSENEKINQDDSYKSRQSSRRNSQIVSSSW